MVDPEEKNARKQEKANLVEQLEMKEFHFFRAVPRGIDGGKWRWRERFGPVSPTVDGIFLIYFLFHF
jgi:hypothetical protein